MKKLTAFILSCLMLAGCGGSAKSGSGQYYSADSMAAPAEAAYGSMAYNSYDAEEADKGSSYSVYQEDSADKLVYTGNVHIETKEYDAFRDELNGILKEYHAVTQSMQESGSSGSRRYMNLTVRIPAQDFDSFINALYKGSGEVTNVSTWVDNITKRYNSNETRIETLETQRTRLLELLQTAENLTDVIQLEQRLSEVEYELNNLKNYKADMDEDVQYSTLDLTISEVIIYNSKVTFVQRFREALTGSWTNFRDFLEDFVIDAVYALPFLIVLAALIWLFRKPLKTLNERRKAKRAAKKAAKEKSDPVKAEEI